MGLYNFKERFAPFILDGRKRHTIRATRKVRDKVGNTAHLFTGLRTKNTTLLGRYPIIKIEEIEIISGCACGGAGTLCEVVPRISVDGVELSLDEREKLARLDGFKDFAEMKEFWKGRLPLKGEIVHWQFD